MGIEGEQLSYIIGIAGAAGSGKNAVADILRDECGFVEVALADVMKRIAITLWDWPKERLWGASNLRGIADDRYTRPNGEPLTPRYALQLMGTQFGRTCEADVWVRYTLDVAHKLSSSGIARGVNYHYTPEDGLVCTSIPIAEKPKGVAIPDVRFANEIRAIRSSGGKVWRVVRNGSGLKGEAGQHESEQELKTIDMDKFDVVIDNNGTLEELRAKVLEQVKS